MKTEYGIPLKESIAAMVTEWIEITADDAWKRCEVDGISPPFAGYMKELSNGTKVRCWRKGGETKFELQESHERRTENH